ncbi:MAG: sigma-70 family RNA polymerase sigma factor [Acidobacteriia bacterium]|nr:sigma-70 family RNA polymerase sigma factor [Terriglobia bacterium]
MPEISRTDVTRLLAEWAGGSESALEILIPIVYAELRRMAGRYLRRERPGHTLDSVALVHEAYLRLVDQTPANLQNRAQFYGISARLMRQILTDHARNNMAAKRGGGIAHISLRESLHYAPEHARDVVALDDALTALAAFDPRKSKMIELHFFGGFTVEETAEAFGLSRAGAGRELKLAEAWLYRQIKRSSE